jgi:hypothetical protein
MLKNGGMVRGTILEIVPDEHVIIASATGEQRKFAMSEVTYAGPKAQMPVAPPPPVPAPAPVAPAPSQSPAAIQPFVTTHAPAARLRLLATERGVTFHRKVHSGSATLSLHRVDTAGFETICTAPCEVTMPAGNHVLGLSKDGEPASEASTVTIPAGNSTLHGEVADRSALRLLGWGALIGGVGGGAYLMFTSAGTEEKCDESGCMDEPTFDATKAVVGLALLTGGSLAWWVLHRTKDGAEIRVEPGAPGAKRGSRPPTELDRRRTAAVPGLTLSGLFF